MTTIKNNADAKDTATRRRIEEELDKNFMIEAAAGTGKTTSMINRMVSLIANGVCEIDQLAAVTFTRKAAAELRERFQSQLRREAARLQAERSSGSRNRSHMATRERLQRSSDHCNRAFVGTIHSFCASLLRERPIEFGVEPAFRELDECEELRLRDQAWQEYINDLLATNDPLVSQLKERGLERQKLRQQFDQFIAFRDVRNWPHTAASEIDLTTVQQQTRDYISHMQTLKPLFPRERGSDKLMNHYEHIIRASDRSFGRQADFFSLLESFDTSHGATQKCWHDKGVAKSESLRWTDFRSEVVKPALEAWYQHRYQVIVEFLSRAVTVYERIKAASGGLDFNDLLLLVASGLKKQPELRRYFASRYSHLLVDEFQDTDPVQAEIILYLTADDSSQQDWRRCIPRAGSLFVVGDPKQSIYRFRRGDIVTYNGVKQLFETSGGEVLPLVKNFRSHADLIAWNNSIYQQKFLPEADRYAPAAEDMVQGRQDKCVGELKGIHRLAIDAELNIAEAMEREADAIARFIRYAIDGGMTVSRTDRELELGRKPEVEFRDFLIIPYGKKRIDYFKKALDKYEIPNEVTGDNALVNVQQLDCLIAILRCIDDPQHPVHLLAVLRDRLFGFSDLDLYHFKRQGGRFQFTAPIPDELDAELGGRFQDAFDRLKRYQGWLRALPFAAAVQCIAEDLGLLAAAAAESEGNVAAGGLLKAIELLRQQSLNFDSASDLIDFLEQLDTLNESEGCTALPPNPNVVRVMNLHKAKGLEAPIVFLADTSKKYNHPVSCHIDRTGREPVGYMGITVKKGRSTTTIAIPDQWERRQQEEQRFLDAEADRLLYVATTRAACALVVSVGKANSNWGDLHDYVQDAPELQIPSEKQLCDVQRRDKPLRSPKQKTLTAQQIADKWSAAAQPSYNIATAKDLALAGVSRPRWQTSGQYGHRWGSAVHELLEICHKSPRANLHSAALTLASQHELGAERIEELVETVQSVVQSDIWKRAQAALQCFSELPIETTKVDDSGNPIIVRSVIDLIFEEPDGWVIVDYKTDDVAEADLAAAVDYYGRQLIDYSTYWQAATGLCVKELGLYFTRCQSFAVCDPL